MCFSVTIHAESGQTYLDKFMKYSAWNQHLPTSTDADFIAFISKTSPLSQKLREKWLYQLASKHAWDTYSQYYQPSTDTSLQCYAQMALYQQGQRQQALPAAQLLWLNGHSEPKACTELYTLLLKNHDLDENLITQRVKLALEENNLPLTTYLLKQYTPPRLIEIALLIAVHQNTSRIIRLDPSELHSEFYLYGLKRMVSANLDQALEYWQLAKTKQMLSHAQQQAFLGSIALYKAMRNHPDAPIWFAKVEPAFYTDVLLEWQIRFALKYKQWHQVEQLINHSHNKDNPCWQYWLARALDEQGQKISARAIYQILASTRNYYGFLSSLKLNQRFSFKDEHVANGAQHLLPYQPFIDQIKTLYASNQTLQASRLLNDFMSELPKDDRVALDSWVANELQWYGKSVYLSNNDELSNQLTLRFPLAYRETIATNAKDHQISPALIYAIIRQESAFRDDATSAAGAEGLMQLMPATAQVVAKQAKIAYSNKKQLFLANQNISIGVAYLQQLSRRFKKHPLLMVAAYNAGPKQVVYWLKNHPPKDIDIWVETLPWHETRNYLKNVISFYAVYQYRLQEKPDLTPFMQGFIF